MTDAVSFNFRASHESLLKVAKPTPQPNFVGAWSTIELQPDIFAPQRFTVGVAVQAEGERVFFKLLEDFKKFDCVYPDAFPLSVAKALMAYAFDALSVAIKSKTPLSEIRFDSHYLSLSAPAFTSGADKEATVERLFAEVVSMAPSAKNKKNEFESLDNSGARKLVNIYLKQIAGLDFERFAQEENFGLLVPTDNGSKHFLDLNLLTPNGCGSVTSAVYKTPSSVEMNLLKASLDLKTCKNTRNFKDMGLFLLMPDPDRMLRKDYRNIEEVIKAHEWKLEGDGFRVVSLQDPAQLAQEVYDWAEPSLR